MAKIPLKYCAPPCFKRYMRPYYQCTHWCKNIGSLACTKIYGAARYLLDKLDTYSNWYIRKCSKHRVCCMLAWTPSCNENETTHHPESNIRWYTVAICNKGRLQLQARTWLSPEIQFLATCLKSGCQTCNVYTTVSRKKFQKLNKSALVERLGGCTW